MPTESSAAAAATAESTPGLQADLLVIGFGKAGKSLAAALGKAGRRVVMVEQSPMMYGGTCINIGCVPSKALIVSAHQRHAESDDAWFSQAITRKNALTSLLRAKNLAKLEQLDAVTVVTGRARFLDDSTVEVTAGADRLRISAETIVINTGSVPRIPAIDGISESSRVVTSAELLDTSQRPSRLAVLGGGYLGLEFAQMYRGFGVDVDVITPSTTLLPNLDDDVSASLTETFESEGIRLHLGTRAVRVEDTDDGVRVYLQSEESGSSATLEADLVLLATGREPATNDLGLEAAGVEITQRGAVRVDEHLRTSRPHIFAVGDVNGGPQFTYISFDDYRIVKDQLVGDGTRATSDRRAVPTTTFVTPPLSHVGLTEAEARGQGHRVRVASKPVAQIAAMPRARILDDARGLMKVVVDADTGLILGATVYCVDSQETINLIALAMRHGIPAASLRDSIFTHPSATEGLNEVLAEI